MSRRGTLCALALMVAGLAGCAGQAKDAPYTVQVDPQRYQGTWYELARKPMFFQRHCAQSEAHYRLRADGAIAVLNRCRSASGEWQQVTGSATPQVAGRTDAFWVRFDNWPTRLFPNLIRGDYRVLYVDPDYQTALVGNRGRDYLWLLSRQPTLPEATVRRLLSEANRNGYDTSDLIWRSKDSAIGGGR
ncbi:lipocalin family protein [Pseudomonas panipatensis]|jgi:apolipoprotein D and lipocalin family protein|uniref:Outer membrane lipoprotein Blc n=1 Tax=Pseudomonas panipatensis TaxID=428992 RepID=A0A1G8K4U5_9PSED|nr:lipocalin family protein [Pseudomonas panipatensis]SDI38451.1 apolipoprotein D and lipocalin family protein [Pseudomonas panipatensis]SMP60833.1 apolipoprotein D and lipocalin family protein [Pseudomonas panipatensis]